MSAPRTQLVDRARHGQLISSRVSGDCFRASLSVLLDVPNGDHMPNPHDERGGWFFEWRRFLDPLGVRIMQHNAQGPVWKSHRWIASVPSKNEPGCTHAIVMRSGYVEFDPSPRRRYRRGTSLLGKGVVVTGHWLEIADASKLGEFVKWQRRINRRAR